MLEKNEEQIIRFHKGIFNGLVDEISLLACELQAVFTTRRIKRYLKIVFADAFNIANIKIFGNWKLLITNTFL